MKTDEPIRGRAVVGLRGREGEIMFMPAGRHTIHATQGGRQITAEVLVDSGAAAALQAQLERVNARGKQRAFFDFDHSDTQASAWPREFFWRPDGVWCRLEWSAAGRGAVDGRSYRAFSPVFHVDRSRPARVICQESADLNFGGLVNDPAFEAIEPLWAKQAISGASTPGSGTKAGATGTRGKHESTQNNRVMTKEEKATLQAKRKQLEQDIEDLRGQEQTAEVAESLQAKQAELTVASAQLEAEGEREKNMVLEQALLAQRTKDARAAVSAAVKRGAIPAQNLDLQAKWEKRCVEDPENLQLLESIKGSAAITLPRLSVSQVQITRESSLSVLNAFASEADPRKRAAIYAKEIKPRLAEGDDMPIQALNNPGTLTGTLVTQRTLELLRVQFPLLAAISSDFSDQAASYNQTITSRIIGIPDVQTFDSGGAGTGWPDSDATMTDVPVTMDHHVGVPITFSSQTLSSTVRRLFDEIAPAQAYALAKNMVDALYAIITAANFTEQATVSAQVNFGRATVIDMSAAMTPRGVPQGPLNRTLLLNSAYFGQLSKDQAIVTLAAFQKADIIEQGVLPNVQGFKVVEAPNLPNTGNLAGFGMSRSALVLATRVDNDYTRVLSGASYGNVTTVTDPDTGLTVLQVQYVSHKTATATQRVSLMYGVAKGQPKAGQLLLSAAA